MKRGELFCKLQRRFRKKRFEICDALLRGILKEQPEVSVLDTGGRPDYWEILAPDLRDKVRIIPTALACDSRGIPLRPSL